MSQRTAVLRRIERRTGVSTEGLRTRSDSELLRELSARGARRSDVKKIIDAAE